MNKENQEAGGGRGSENGREAAAPAETRGVATPVIALQMEDLVTWLAERVAKFPREHRFTVGDRLLDAGIDVLSLLVEASYRRDKREALSAASRGLVRARVLARLARALRCLSDAQLLHFARETDEIGRMLGGWIRAGRAR